MKLVETGTFFSFFLFLQLFLAGFCAKPGVKVLIRVCLERKLCVPDRVYTPRYKSKIEGNHSPAETASTGTSEIFFRKRKLQ